ncbi:hypothetical protein FEM48_Zijuj01G0038700 [Ziziphus jujuba var. spinosa]|uniref:Pentatricopeptide repeat-containing protein n=1 Tax=Ziziphus jujuba var. spinosa TaxID=714518 RepID=A0A978VZ01_ZIZJJ|nr:hypothetical protein FEM48_Zijuj01G0038700 [Ziziphus jujuba var. spinosa]
MEVVFSYPHNAKKFPMRCSLWQVEWGLGNVAPPLALKLESLMLNSCLSLAASTTSRLNKQLELIKWVKMKNGTLPAIKSSVFSSSNKFLLSVAANNTSPPTLAYIAHPSAAALSTVLQHYIDSDNPSHGQKIHTHVLKSGFKPNTNISIKLLILHLKCGSLRYARQMFDELPQQTLSAYNYIIGGYLKQGQVEESLSLVRKLIFSGEKPDGFTFSMVLKASSCVRNVPLPYSLGRVVHAQIIKSDVAADDVLYTALVDSYVKNGKVGCARTLFDMMLKNNVICSTSMISGPLGFLLGLPFAFVSLLLSLVVEFALALIKAPFSVMEWFTSKIPC